jgi:hypothetical protein
LITQLYHHPEKNDIRAFPPNQSNTVSLAGPKDTKNNTRNDGRSQLAEACQEASNPGEKPLEDEEVKPVVGIWLVL